MHTAHVLLCTVMVAKQTRVGSRVRAPVGILVLIVSRDTCTSRCCNSIILKRNVCSSFQEFSLAREQREEEVEKERLLKEKEDCRKRERQAKLDKLARQRAKRRERALGAGGRGGGGAGGGLNGAGGE